MFQGLTRRHVIIAMIGAIVAAALTVEGIYYVLHRFVLTNPNDPQRLHSDKPPELRNK
jgi:hypothetical protein